MSTHTHTQHATRLLELVGGKENISAVTHCLTRMTIIYYTKRMLHIICLFVWIAIKSC